MNSHLVINPTLAGGELQEKEVGKTEINANDLFLALAVRNQSRLEVLDVLETTGGIFPCAIAKARGLFHVFRSTGAHV
jgi:hypothetical protein